MSLLDALFLDPAPLDIWLTANRPASGFQAGTGTLNDPYAVNSATQFDTLLNNLAASGRTQNMRVHLGPGIFYTKGYSDDVATGGFQIQPGMKIIGSGVDVTTIQLTPNAQAQPSNAQLFAIGHALVSGGQSSLVDSAEICAMTIDCNLPAFSGSNVACGAARLMGNNALVKGVKAVHWGANANRPALVFAVITAQIVGTTATEVENCGLEGCLALLPSATAGQITVFHAGPTSLLGAFIEAYGKGPFIRNCFLDCGSIPTAFEARGLSMAWCKNGVIQSNQIFNSNIGGPYAENTSLGDVAVTQNYYKNVVRAAYWKLGGVNPATPTGLSTLARDPINHTIALATTGASHGLQPGERIKIDASVGSPSQFKGIFLIKDVPQLNQSRYQMQSDPMQDAASGTMQKVFAIGRTVVEDNLMDLATTSTFAAIQIDDSNASSQMPDYVHGDVIIRGNKVRFADGLFDPAYLAYGVDVSGAKCSGA